ncbi:DUF5658 family protein [Haloarcula salina]|uniref:DUF5658 family protein n=1 Tax=Haloarcula salina TaxID=1429914 RepID=UPI003C6F8C82
MMTTDSGPSADDGSWRAWFGSHDMSEADVVLWTAVLVATVGDILLTLTGLTAGLQEGNVVVRTMLAEFGVAGFWLVKFVAMLWLVAGWRVLDERKATAFLALFAVVTLAVVAHNSLVILQYRGLLVLFGPF